MTKNTIADDTQTRIDYLINCRRTLHRCPEVGFEVPETCSLIERFLDELGIVHTQKYCKYSVVGYVGTRTDVPVIAVRADMDGLPVEEKTGLDYASEKAGFMHACGHDAHMAMLLGAARTLKPIEDSLPFRLKMIFQPAEESADSGARIMFENGVLDDVDYVLCQHVDGSLDSGCVGYAYGTVCSACTPIDITFHGKTAHATIPHKGHDAIAMMFKTYSGIQLMLSREIDPFENMVCSVGAVNGGVVHNVVCDKANMKISLRTFDVQVNDFVVDRVKLLAEHAAKELGGTVNYEAHMSAPAVVNDDFVVDCLKEAAEDIYGDNVRLVRPKMSSDDFSWFAANKPSVYYWLGIRNLSKWHETSLHNNDFMVDDDALLGGEKLLINTMYKLAKAIQ